MGKPQRRLGKEFERRPFVWLRRVAAHSVKSPRISALVCRRCAAGSTSAASVIWRRRLPSGRKTWPLS